MTKIEQLREQTYQEMIYLLKTYGQCAVVRPTGFGKTGLLTRLIKSHRYKKILYLYPTEVIKQAVLNFYYSNPKNHDSINNVTFMTYMKLTQLSESDMKELQGTDLIICDECHRIGAPMTMIGLNDLLEMNPKPHIVGATATPERMDLVDEISYYFDDHCTSPYTLHDAIVDGIVQKPIYTFCAYGESDPKTLARLKKDLMIKVQDLNIAERTHFSELINARLLEIARLSKMETAIQQTLAESNVDTSYQKYIVFFKDFAHMRRAKKNVKKWFKTVFPNHTITELIVSSENSEYESNVDKLPELTRKENHIDFIYAINMMNMGHHAKDLTGIIMYRGTYSGIIYSQQLGRAISTGDSDAKVVFDIVDNLHRKSVYELLNEQSAQYMTQAEQEEFEKLAIKMQTTDPNTGKFIGLTKEEKARFAQLNKKKIASNPNETGTVGGGNKIIDYIPPNDIRPEDLVVTGYSCELKELVAKVVAEAIAMRCRQAWARWVEKGGDPGDMTREYILGQKAPQYVPLGPFCKLKNVAINAVLAEMKVS